MGWINTLFDVATLSAELYNINQVQQLKAQGASAQLLQVVLHELRTRVFYYEQTARTILDVEASEPLAAAGAMRVLELRLMDSGIVPELFQGSSLDEMNSVANVFRLIQTNSRRMCEKLPPTDQAALNRMADMADNLPNYAYYLAHYGDYLNYLQAKSDYESAPWMTSQIQMGGLGCAIFAVVIWLSTTLFVRSAAMQWILVAAAFALSIYLGMKARTARAGKKTMETLGAKLNLDQMAKIHSGFRGDKNAVQQAHDAAQSEIRDFFGSSTLLPA